MAWFLGFAGNGHYAANWLCHFAVRGNWLSSILWEKRLFTLGKLQGDGNFYNYFARDNPYAALENLRHKDLTFSGHSSKDPPPLPSPQKKKKKKEKKIIVWLTRFLQRSIIIDLILVKIAAVGLGLGMGSKAKGKMVAHNPIKGPLWQCFLHPPHNPDEGNTDWMKIKGWFKFFIRHLSSFKIY